MRMSEERVGLLRQDIDLIHNQRLLGLASILFGRVAQVVALESALAALSAFAISFRVYGLDQHQRHVLTAPQALVLRRRDHAKMRDRIVYPVMANLCGVIEDVEI